MNRIFPIHFSIPEEKIVKEIPKKKKILAFVIPGERNTYIFQNERDYYKDYQESMFAITMKKCGWDCLRHYEILANGCIPYFKQIDDIPRNTMIHFPKEMIQKSNLFYKRIQYKKIDEVSEEEWSEYNQYVNYYLIHMKEHLTTLSISKYILEKIEKKNIGKILFLSQNVEPDYLRCLTLHGFKSIFHTEVHDYPKINHLYKISNFPYHLLYGKGITYSNLLNNLDHDDEKDMNIRKDIKNHEYDIIIYGSYHRGLPYWEMVNQYYKKDEIILLCGEDEHDCDSIHYALKGYTLFIRELN